MGTDIDPTTIPPRRQVMETANEVTSSFNRNLFFSRIFGLEYRNNSTTYIVQRRKGSMPMRRLKAKPVKPLK